MIQLSITEQIADFIHKTEEIPDSVRHTSKRAIANALVRAVSAAYHPVIEISLNTIAEFSDTRQSTIFGRAERLSPQWAAFINGMGILINDFDDTHAPTAIHVTAPTIAAALAVAECHDLSGATFLDSVAMGIEISLRIARGILPGHFDAGWAIVGTIGHIGACLSAGRALKLTKDEVVNSIGIVSTQASGLRAAFGMDSRLLHGGKAAFDGVEAAILASMGFTGPKNPLEGNRGFAEIISPSVDYSLILCDLGDKWELKPSAIEPYILPSVDYSIENIIMDLLSIVGSVDLVDSIRIVINPSKLTNLCDFYSQEISKAKLRNKCGVAEYIISAKFGKGAGSHPLFQSGNFKALDGKIIIQADHGIQIGEIYATAKDTQGNYYHLQTKDLEKVAPSHRSEDEFRYMLQRLIGNKLGNRVEDFIDTCFRIGDGSTSVRQLIDTCSRF